MKRCFDKEEFDTDRSKGFLIGYYAPLFLKRKVFASVRNGLSNIILQETGSVMRGVSLLFLSISNCFMC